MKKSILAACLLLTFAASNPLFANSKNHSVICNALFDYDQQGNLAGAEWYNSLLTKNSDMYLVQSAIGGAIVGGLLTNFISQKFYYDYVHGSSVPMPHFLRDSFTVYTMGIFGSAIISLTTSAIIKAACE